LWSDVELYDFGLRSLISIIELSSIIYKGEGKGIA
jgi:regulator of sigma D